MKKEEEEIPKVKLFNFEGLYRTQVAWSKNAHAKLRNFFECDDLKIM